MLYEGTTHHCVKLTAELSIVSVLYRARERVVSENLHKNPRWPTEYRYENREP